METEAREAPVAQPRSPAAEAARPAAPAPHRRDDEFTAERQVHEPHRIGLPPLLPYVRALWRRREFALQLSRTTLRAQHFNTFFGQLWLVINPVLLGLIYFMLVDILHRGSRGADFFAHLLAGLFAFSFVHQSVTQGAKSVVGGGRLILNTAFPRSLLPLASVLTALTRFVPTMLVYAIVHVATGRPAGPELLWALPVLVCLVVFAMGISMLVAAAQVYFRDVSSFLPYMLRIWLYASPVLYYYDEVPARFKTFLAANPLTALLGAWSPILTQGKAPSPGLLAACVAWAVAALVIGGLFFLSREREFAVRL